jgi:UBX domain-containing protein 1
VAKITLYENGFTVDDGEFQDYNNPKNKDFMKELNEGIVPKELKKKYPNGGLSVSLNDKTS